MSETTPFVGKCGTVLQEGQRVAYVLRGKLKIGTIVKFTPKNVGILDKTMLAYKRQHPDYNYCDIVQTKYIAVCAGQDVQPHALPPGAGERIL